jgi:hypothetical protein
MGTVISLVSKAISWLPASQNVRGAGEQNRAEGPGGSRPAAAATWASVASQVVSAASDSWGKLARMCVLMLCAAGIGYVILLAVR